jgi:hypothetical protein
MFSCHCWVCLFRVIVGLDPTIQKIHVSSMEDIRVKPEYDCFGVFCVIVGLVFFCVIVGLVFFLSLSDLIRQSKRFLFQVWKIFGSSPNMTVSGFFVSLSDLIRQSKLEDCRNFPFELIEFISNFETKIRTFFSWFPNSIFISLLQTFFLQNQIDFCSTHSDHISNFSWQKI